MFKASDIKIVCDPAIPEDSMVIVRTDRLYGTSCEARMKQLAAQEVLNRTMQMWRETLESAAFLRGMTMPLWPGLAPIELNCCVYHKLTGFNDHKCAGRAPNPHPMPKDYVKA